MKKKIYILAPANTATGGPEALHQLAYSLKKKNFNISMHYLPYSQKKLIHHNYKRYRINYAKIIEDKSNNVLIIPEYYFFLNESKKYKKITKILWWLSLDNYLISKFRFVVPKLIRSIFNIPFKLVKFFNYLTLNKFGLLTYQSYIKHIFSIFNIKEFKEFKDIKFHYAQSYYAYNFLKKSFFRNTFYLADYQRKEFLHKTNNFYKFKENLICYYPFKSNEFINRIINFDKKIKFIPIVNFSTKELINLLKKTKIYIDFGFHPGKDRLPREALLFGNCIITNKQGSANNKVDIPITNEFKFDENRSNLLKINKKIINIFNNYQKEFLKFQNYFEIVKNEERLFNIQVSKNFNFLR